MSEYTQSIREILQYNKQPTENLVDISDVYAISNRCLFDHAPMSVIDSDYRQQFITGFTLHFMNEEIGYETLPLWKIALNEKIYNNGTYINKIFANLDKEIFAEYRVKNVSTEGAHYTTKNGTGTISNASTDNATTTSTDNLSKSETVNNTLNGTVTGTGTITDTKTGTETTAKAGTDEHAKTGTDEHAKTGNDGHTKTGTETDAKTGYDSAGHTGTDATAHTGTQETVTEGSQDTTNTGTTSTDKNTIQITSDTPMGSLANLRTPGGDAKGTGVTYANGQTYNYMSGAVEFDDSNVQTDNTEQQVDSDETATTTFADTVTETKNLTDRTDYNSTDTKTYNLTESDTFADTVTDTYNSTDTETIDLTDETTYDTIDTETKSTSDTTRTTEETRTSGTDTKTGSVTESRTGSDTETRNTTDTDNGTHSEDTDEIDYSLNWEMLYRSMPLLNKVWEIFDDLFMIIF